MLQRGWLAGLGWDLECMGWGWAVGMAVTVRFLSPYEDTAFGVVDLMNRGVKGEVTADDNGGTRDKGDVVRGLPKWPPGGCFQK